MHVRATAHLLTAVLLLPVVGCSAMLPPVLPEPDVDLGLGDVVLLTWTTRSPEGILGHAMTPEAIGVDPHRRVVDGKARWVETSQKMRFMFTRQRSVQGKVEAGVMGATASVGQATHIAYDVHLTRYLELPPDVLHYSAASGCCFDGQVTSSCGQWYVIRMMWGSGRVQYLQQVDANASVSASDLLRAQGGTTYRRLNETSFDQSFFAYEAVPLADFCASVQPEEELPTLSVRAPKNCWALAQRSDGTSAAGAWHLSDERSCREVVRNLCSSTNDLMSCHMTFGNGEDTQRAAIPLSELAPATKPTSLQLTPARDSSIADAW